MTDTNHPAEKMLTKFEKDFKKLLAKYPEVRVCTDHDGYLRAITMHGMESMQHPHRLNATLYTFAKRYLPQAHQPEPSDF